MPPEIHFDPDSHTYTVAGKVKPSVTEILGSVGLGFEAPVSGEVLEAAQSRGIYVHDACAMLDRGETLDPSSIPPEWRGYIDAYLKFRSDLPITPISVEEKLYHPRLDYCGTVDLVAWVPGHGRVVIDRKTGEPGPGAGPQTAAYAKAWDPVKVIKGVLTLRLKPDGKYQLTPIPNLESQFNVFLAALTIYRHKEAK